MIDTKGFDPQTGDWNDSLTGDYLWTKTNLGEAIPETMTPFSWSVAQFTFSDLSYLPGFPVLGNLCGFPYFNISSLVSALHTLGLSRKYALGTLEDLLNIRLPEHVEIPLIPYPRWKFIAIIQRFISLFSHFDQGMKDVPDYLSINRDWFERTRARITQEPDLAGLNLIWQEEIRAHLRRGFWITVSTANSSAEYTYRLRRRLIALVGPADANILIANLNNDSGLLASMGPVVGLFEVARGKMTRDAYLEQFGHRGPNEFELSVPRPAEDPVWMEQELSRLLAEPADVQSLMRCQQETFDEAWARFVHCFPHKAKTMERNLGQSARLARLRELVRSEYVRDRWIARLFAIRAGELLDLGNDVFFLTVDELLAALSRNQDAFEYISIRKEMYQRLKTLPPFPTIIRGHFDPFKWAEDPQRSGEIYEPHPTIAKTFSDIITGSPGSSGNVEGEVRVITDPRDGSLLQHGEILVAVQTDIAWTLLFPRAAAVVTDVGAVLSHAAIVARELGIPAVVGCGDATSRLKTGDRVRVDGSAGTVTMIWDVSKTR